MNPFWRCAPCGLDIEQDSHCPRCGAPPSGPLLGAEMQLHFTGQRIPKED